jgi:hypothetical protein
MESMAVVSIVRFQWLLEMVENEISQAFVIAQEVDDFSCNFYYLHVEQS